MSEVLEEAERVTGRRSKSAVSRLLNISHTAAHNLVSGGVLPLSILDEVERNLHHREDGTLRVRLHNILIARPNTMRRLLSDFRRLAYIVQEYKEWFKVRQSMRNGWDLPPFVAVKQMCLAMEEGYRMLVRIHKECPEIDAIVFRDAKGLLEEISRSDAKLRKQRGRSARRVFIKQPRNE